MKQILLISGVLVFSVSTFAQIHGAGSPLTQSPVPNCITNHSYIDSTTGNLWTAVGHPCTWTNTTAASQLSTNNTRLGTNDTSLFNPTRSGLGANNITGKFESYFWTGTIPGTSAFNFGQVNHYNQSNYFLDSVPGCYGFQGSCYNSQHGWETTTVFVNGAGGTNVHTLNAQFFSVGDHIGYENYITSFGGSSDGGGPEGTKGASYFIGEAGSTWTGAVASGHGGVGQTTLTTTCSTDCGGSGYGISGNTPAAVGQGLWVTDEQTTTASGQIESVTNGSGETPGTFTVNITSGISHLALSTCEATLTSKLSPTTNPSGSGSQTLTFTVTDVAGTCTSGGLMSFSGTNHEQAIITSVTVPSGGRQTITANIRLSHGSGSYIFENANSDAGLFADLVANDTGGLKFPFEVLGVQSISGHTAVMWWRHWYAGSQPSFTGFPFGHAVIGTNGVGTMTNTGGTVSFVIYQNWNVNGTYWQALNGAPAIYFSGAANRAFDGPCTNVTISFPNNANPGTGTCTQAASTGQTGAGASASLTDSTQDNPYGNSRVNFYQGASIVDPQDYSAPIVENGVTNYPVDGLQFAVEPNEMPLNAGDALVEHHSTAQFHNQELTVGVVNPVNYTSDGINVQFGGVYANGGGGWQNNTPLDIKNTSPISQYRYFGGTMVATPYMVAQGLWANYLDAQYPPTFGNSLLNVRNCPPTAAGCSDTTYYYNLYDFLGNSGANYASYFPATNTMQWNGPQVFKSAVKAASISLSEQLNQSAANKFAGTCTMSSGTSCTITLGASFASTPVCIVTVQSSTVIAGGCTVSGTKVTITAASGNSSTWGAMLIGNPN